MILVTKLKKQKKRNYLKKLCNYLETVIKNNFDSVVLFIHVLRKKKSNSNTWRVILNFHFSRKLNVKSKNIERFQILFKKSKNYFLKNLKQIINR